MIKKISLKNKLTFAASLAITIGGLFVEALSYNASLNRLENEVESSLTGTVTAYNQYVVDWLASKERSLTSLSSDIPPQNVITHLEQVRHSGAFDNVFLALPDGSQKNANEVILPAGNNDPREWGWYINAIKAPSKVFMDNPTVAAATGANVVSLGKAIQFSGSSAVLGADVEITDIVNGLSQVILPGTGYMFIMNEQGNVFTHANTQLLHKPVSELGLTAQIINAANRSSTSVMASVNGMDSVIRVIKIPGTSLTTVAVVDYSSLVAPLNDAIWKQVLAALVIVIICIVLFSALCNILFKPLNNVSNALEKIATGDADLTQRIHVESNDEVGKLANNFNLFVTSLNTLIANIRTQSSRLNDYSEENSQLATKAVDGVNQQQQEITMVATAVHELSLATQEISQNAVQAANAARESEDNTVHGQEMVHKTRGSINRLAEELETAGQVVSDLDKHAQEISTVLSTIQGIAEQTNLLALNAAIEAARAGEQGRGFAVVADEVRVLSQRTHSSTEEIKATIETLQNTTNKAVTIMESSAEFAENSVEDADKATLALKEINSSVSLISDMATQIATAAEEQTHVTSQVTENITLIKDVADQLVLHSQDSSSSSSKVKLELEELSQKVSTFKVS
ncbi:methyl-accepting chemotaxis protein [Vibrio hippocampi]|uniref:Methyl-accepting chemotaxis protein PctC n=1 Tax=Vibrio hippocampi TaxID=654686 RepID=A0ABM8ZGR6_9VIBR|nr:methyl-accepting chemotaxis protein [Vibrio hippocampi]CAH0525697.1 Methyl-accepting chemotaxis protein PctC [Vibrio hippocampi]